MVKYEAAIKEVDVKLSVSGGDSGKGPKQQKTEITIYTIRNGVVCPHLSHVSPLPLSHPPDELMGLLALLRVHRRPASSPGCLAQPATVVSDA